MAAFKKAFINYLKRLETPISNVVKQEYHFGWIKQIEKIYYTECLKHYVLFWKWEEINGLLNGKNLQCCQASSITIYKDTEYLNDLVKD